MKMLVVNEFGCVYRLDGDTLEFAPLMNDGSFDTDDFGAVEPELVGEENVTFRGVDTNLYGVFATVTRELKETK